MTTLNALKKSLSTSKLDVLTTQQALMIKGGTCAHAGNRSKKSIKNKSAKSQKSVKGGLTSNNYFW